MPALRKASRSLPDACTQHSCEIGKQVVSIFHSHTQPHQPIRNPCLLYTSIAIANCNALPSRQPNCCITTHPYVPRSECGDLVDAVKLESINHGPCLRRGCIQRQHQLHPDPEAGRGVTCPGCRKQRRGSQQSFAMQRDHQRYIHAGWISTRSVSRKDHVFSGPRNNGRR